MSHRRVEDLEKHGKILEEKLIRYEETMERLVKNENHQLFIGFYTLDLVELPNFK